MYPISHANIIINTLEHKLGTEKKFAIVLSHLISFTRYTCLQCLSIYVSKSLKYLLQSANHSLID